MAHNMCTCTDVDCPFHMMNNQGSCTKCIAKNLKCKEIPSCFFNMISVSEDRAGDYSFESFCRCLEQYHRREEGEKRS